MPVPPIDTSIGGTTAPSFESYGGTAPQNYEQFFVQSIAAPLARDLGDVALLHPGEGVLDVACGTGVVARVAAEYVGAGGAVDAVDINPGMLEVARSIEASGAPIGWHEASAENLPFADASYDVVLSQMGLQFFSDKPAALDQMRRVLRPEGRLVASVPAPIPALFSVLAEALERHVHTDAAAFVHHVFSLHRRELQDLVSEAGFADVSVRTSDKILLLPAPSEFLWQYVMSTPLGTTFAGLDEIQRSDFGRDVAERWEPFVERKGLMLRLGVVTATAHIG